MVERNLRGPILRSRTIAAVWKMMYGMKKRRLMIVYALFWGFILSPTVILEGNLVSSN